jgi:CheY-like chemotaxis protein
VEALEQCRDFRPDVILLDIAMPGSVDGFEVCQEIRRDPAIAGTKVVMLSAHARSSDLAAGRASGADAYLVKPFSPLALMDLVARLTGVAAAGGRLPTAGRDRAAPVQAVA